jgi:cell fate (sporulation/competence/biofilm development) regulator YlbF (YheA/YmcA/DUF963 family)
MTTEASPVLQKTKELCQTILDQPNMKSIRQRIDAFMQDEKTKLQYQSLVEKGQTLQQKQQQGTELSNPEIADFEKDREALLNNPVARGFLDAQEDMHEVKHQVHQFLNKTFELGRLPTDEELNSGGGCGSHGSGGCCGGH